MMLIGNETDVLHCGFSHAISEGGKRYPSADHYAHAQMLHMLGLDDVHILELLATPSCDVPVRARQLLQENMPTGHDMNSLASYLQVGIHCERLRNEWKRICRRVDSRIHCKDCVCVSRRIRASRKR